MSSRLLLPHEHGAYVQLAAPLVAALIGQVPTLPAVLLALGACLAFVASEPLRVILGHRGKRALERDGARARRWLMVTATLALATGGAGVVLASPAARAMAGIAAIAAIVLLRFTERRAERTFAGEMAAACALTGAAAPVAVAAGASIESALIAWGAWFAGYAATVIAVHRVIERHRKPATRLDHGLALGLAAGVIVAVLAALQAPIVAVAAVLLALSAGLVAFPPSARRLRAIGVALTLASVAAVTWAGVTSWA